MARETPSDPTRPARTGQAGGGASGGQRLQKVLAAAGVGSRRHCEQLMLEGRVEVDRQVVTELGSRVDPSAQEVRVDGEPLSRPRRRYFLVNRPKGVVTTNRDPAGRPRVIDLVSTRERLFPVGRLDMASEGAILVTNDGEMANRLLHPRYEVERTYHVLVAGKPSRSSLEELQRGVRLAEGRVHVKRLRVKRQRKQSTLLELVLAEGRNREIRRMAARIGHKVLSLKRVAVGPIKLGDLPTGAFRELTRSEIRSLHSLARQARDRRVAPRRDFASEPGAPASAARQDKRARGSARAAGTRKTGSPGGKRVRADRGKAARRASKRQSP